MENIKSMCSAHDWRAIFETETGRYSERVAVWADCAMPDGGRAVVGLVPDGRFLKPATEMENFIGYCIENDIRHYIEDGKG